MTSTPSWVGIPLHREMLISRDNGETWATENNIVLFGSYFFLSTEIVNHQRNVYNIVNLLASIGGLISGVFVTFRLLVQYINKQFIMGKFIRNLYFIELPEQKTLNIFGTKMTFTKVK